MKTHIILTNVASGSFFRVSGRHKPDKYLFERVPGAAHQHRLTIPGAQFEETIDDLSLRLQQLDVPVSIRFELEDDDLKGETVISSLQETILQRDGRIAQLEQEIREAANRVARGDAENSQPQLTRSQRTKKDLEQLQERDDILAELITIAGKDETPLDVIRRLLKGDNSSKASETPSAEEQPAPAETDEIPRPAGYTEEQWAALSHEDKVAIAGAPAPESQPAEGTAAAVGAGKAVKTPAKKKSAAQKAPKKKAQAKRRKK